MGDIGLSSADGHPNFFAIWLTASKALSDSSKEWLTRQESKYHTRNVRKNPLCLHGSLNVRERTELLVRVSNHFPPPDIISRLQTHIDIVSSV